MHSHLAEPQRLELEPLPPAPRAPGRAALVDPPLRRGQHEVEPRGLVRATRGAGPVLRKTVEEQPEAPAAKAPRGLSERKVLGHVVVKDEVVLALRLVPTA